MILMSRPMTLKDLPISFVNRWPAAAVAFGIVLTFVLADFFDWVPVVLIGYNLNYRAKFARLTQATLSVANNLLLEPRKACLEAHSRGRSVISRIAAQPRGGAGA